MAKEKFTIEKWNPNDELLVNWMESVTEDYMFRRYTVTLRQLYYVGVAANLYENKQTNYNKLGDLLTKARLAGRIDWHAIVDRNRNTSDHQYFASDIECVQSASKHFRLNKWLTQKVYCEVVVEKAALEGVIARPCYQLEVPFTASRGYASSTLLYDMAHRMRERSMVGGKQCHIFILSDLDPSGVDLARDITDRVRMLADVPVYCHRIALTPDQVDEYKCPPNPAKRTDGRFKGFEEIYGDSSYELDALSPETIEKLIIDSVSMLRDPDEWKKQVAIEQQMKERLANVIEGMKEDDKIENDWD